MFISGGGGPNEQVINDCYTCIISTNTLVHKENMNDPRADHGLLKVAQKVFAFGGADNDCEAMKSAEVYDFVKNSWNNLPEMPQAGDYVTCVRVKNQILLSSLLFRLMSYDIDKEAYSYVGNYDK